METNNISKNNLQNCVTTLLPLFIYGCFKTRLYKPNKNDKKCYHTTIHIVLDFSDKNENGKVY